MRTAAAVLLALLLALPVFGAARHDEPVPAFVAVPVPRASVAAVPSVGLRPISDAFGLRPMPSGKPVVVVPSPHLIVIPRGSSQPTSHRASGTATGRASWYDDGPGLYAAAGPSLRSGHWRGRRVVVCADAQCVRVVLSDWCQCYFRTDRERVIDLSPAAFSQLAPLSRGLVKVTVSW